VGNDQAPNFTADDRIQQALQAFFVVVHARTQVRDQLECPALPGAQNSSRTCFFPFQIVLLVVTGQTGIGGNGAAYLLRRMKLV
jgi:hypothetical protein